MIKFTNSKVHELKSKIAYLEDELDEATTELEGVETKARDEINKSFAGRGKVNVKLTTRSYFIVGYVTFMEAFAAFDVEGTENYISLSDVESIEEIR